MGLRGRRRSGRGRATRGRAGLVGLVLAVYLAGALLSTWPALEDARSDFLAEGLPGLPDAAAPGDHLQAVWQLWLPGHQLGRGAAPWLDPYSFQPEVEARVNFAGWPFAAVFGPLHGLFGTVVAWNLFVLLGYLGAGGLTFLWLRSVGLGVGPSLAGGLIFAIAPYRTVQGGAGHLLAWTAMLLPLSLWAWERRLYLLTAAALATIPLSGQVHLALGALPFVFAYALVRGGDRRWAGGALARPGRALLGRAGGLRVAGSAPRARGVRLHRLACAAPGPPRVCAASPHEPRSSARCRGAASDGARPGGQPSGLRGALGDGSGARRDACPRPADGRHVPRAGGTCRARTGVGDATQARARCARSSARLRGGRPPCRGHGLPADRR